GTLQAGGTITSLGTRTVTLTSTGLIDTNGNSVSIAGVMSGAGGLTKNGSGTLTLSNAANTFSGAVTLNAGTTSVAVLANSGTNSSLGTGAGTPGITLGSATAATLLYTGNTTTSNRALMLGGAGGGTLQMTAAAQTLTLSGTVTATAGTLTLDTGTSNAILTNTSNNFSTVQITSGGAISLVDSNAMTLGSSSLGTLTARTLTGNLTLSGNITASGSGDAIVLAAGGNFNNASGFTLTPGTGRWLVYSTDPTAAGADRGGLVYDFKQYNLAYPGAPTPLTGDGFIYSVAPVITPSLIGTVSKTHDGTTAVTNLTSANFTTSGIIDADTVTFTFPATGTYNNANVGVGKLVTADAISIIGATNGAATVFGYQLAGTLASGNIGTITTESTTVTSEPGVVAAVTTVATQVVLRDPALVAAPDLITVSLALNTLLPPVSVLPNLDSPDVVISPWLSVASCGISLPFTTGAGSCGP
ncbi:MAG: YDG domain-containing protein, partial [Nitrosomonadaceae bacterium]|nr:YDG domain-containing protein [Nitrosomonadaceae bacterium]